MDGNEDDDSPIESAANGRFIKVTYFTSVIRALLY